MLISFLTLLTVYLYHFVYVLRIGVRTLPSIYRTNPSNPKMKYSVVEKLVANTTRIYFQDPI